jgi:hypothetical protein
MKDVANWLVANKKKLTQITTTIEDTK